MARKMILIRDPSSEMRSNSWNSQCLHRMHQRVSTHLELSRQKMVGNFEPKLRAASFVQGSHAERENSRIRVVVGIFLSNFDEHMRCKEPYRRFGVT